ncbi:hypothetical protein GJ688_01815 [Heliobacillus mobilis]|uniref:RNA methyltransferase n=1 Tax=Heliobacterium mobile TaxID=28064 RepID=A0A6I3SBK5_HELMO|nr:hypothetical protein [Heliobacterium mobile]MTV47718.1 hypothetical protein [Heliobacterium mobile]
MATYERIQKYIRNKYGFTVKSCWIAHAKELCGLKPSISPNRKDPEKRVHPCPPDKLEYIKEAFHHFNIC